MWAHWPIISASKTWRRTLPSIWNPSWQRRMAQTSSRLKNSVSSGEGRWVTGKTTWLQTLHQVLMHGQRKISGALDSVLTDLLLSCEQNLLKQWLCSNYENCISPNTPNISSCYQVDTVDLFKKIIDTKDFTVIGAGLVRDSLSYSTYNWTLLSVCNGMFLICIEICEKWSNVYKKKKIKNWNMDKDELLICAVIKKKLCSFENQMFITVALKTNQHENHLKFSHSWQKYWTGLQNFTPQMRVIETEWSYLKCLHELRIN